MASRPWLFGPAPDLMFGCGVLYLLLLAPFPVAGSDAFLLCDPALAPSRRRRGRTNP